MVNEEERDILERFERGDLRTASEAVREMRIARKAAQVSSA